MAETHAYVPAPGNLVQVFSQFRRNFPSNVTAATLKKLGFAPKNEGYVINVLRFLGLIDENGKKTKEAGNIFSLHDDTSFSKAFSEIVKNAYKDLFELHGETAWEQEADTLISFFRQTDQTSEIVGKRQATTFQLLAAFSGHGEMPQSRMAGKGKKSTPAKKPAEKKKPAKPAQQPREQIIGMGAGKQGIDVGLTVRIEINLPADANQATYDRIFKSIKENFLNE